MIALTKEKKLPPFPRAKISEAVKTLLPKGNFKLHVATAKIDDMKIVRVVTPAWKSLRPAERIEKVLRAVSGKLTAEEEDAILRFSVLTPAEYAGIVLSRPRVNSKTPQRAPKPVKAKRVSRSPKKAA